MQPDPFIARPVLFALSALCGLPVYWQLGTLFYNDADDFLNALRLFFQPDWLSFLRGEWADDHWETLKLLFFVGLCAGVSAVIYKGAQHFF